MPSEQGKMTAFDVQRHGFKFPNKMWRGRILIDLPVIGRVDLGPTSYGLCGGMSYSALDTFTHGGAAPDEGSNQPQDGSPLRSYIYDRQQDTFRADNAAMIRQFIEWTPLAQRTQLGVTGLHVRTDREFKRKIAPAIDEGRPVPLGILRAGSEDVLQLNQNNAVLINHQVVAIGYRLCPRTPGMKKHWAVEIYDPNHPGEVHSIHYSDEKRNQTVHFKRGVAVSSPEDPSKNVVESKIRAFFMTPYASKRPYWVG